jgi:hypothetical protein
LAYFALFPGLVAALVHLGLDGIEAGLLVSFLSTVLPA